MRIFIMVFAALAGAISFSNPVKASESGPSFDCKKAVTIIEKNICKSPELSNKDALLNRLYNSTKVSFMGKLPSGQIKAQKDWLYERDNCAIPNGHINGESQDVCLNRFYDNRIFDLAVANLINNYNVAMPIIEKNNQANAPFYKAIYKYTTQRPSQLRNEEIGNLLNPYFLEIKNNWSYPFSILKDDGIVNMSDAFRSDDNFTTTLSIISMAAEGIIVPCDAIYKKPQLIDVLSAHFGSSMDSQLIQSDCHSQAPNLPNLNKLITDINRSSVECSGTIRFAMWRENEKQHVAILLARFDELGKRKPNTIYNELTNKFTKTHPIVMRAAKDELYNYYKSLGKKDISKDKINIILKNYIEDSMFEC